MAPTVVLDYGKDVGGLPYFTVSAESGSPQLKAGYSESARYVSASGDGGAPWGEGDPARSDTYTVTGPGTITNRSVQGGERYEEITLTSPGTLTLTAAGIQYIADRTTADGYQGSFVSSSDQLNKIWYEGAYTAQLDSAAAGSLPGSWRVGGGVLDAYGSAPPNVGLLNQGGSWGDYTATFDTNLVSNQAGWVVRGQDADNGYVFILNAHDDTGGTPDTLQELDLHDGTYTSVGSTPLPAPLTSGSWHTVTTTVSGTTITVSLDNTRLVTLSSTSFPAGTTAYPTGTVGFREYTGEEAHFRNLKVVNSSGTTLYSDALSTASALSAFAVPGVNPVASILDGAKRDRAIWSGDLNVEGPTVYDSTGRTEYLKGALQLLGSHRLSSGFVTGALPPQDALHTGAAIPGTTGTYSATYSMYWLLALESYYLYTGDTAFVQQEWPVAQAELAWNATQVDSRGLFVTDASDGADWDFYDSVKTGAVTEYNLIYYKALLDGAQLATAAGQSTLAATYTQRAADLKAAVNTYLFNSASGLYRISDTRTTGVPQDANALAVLYGVAPAASDASILAALKTSLWTTSYGPVPFSSDAGYSSVISPFAGGYELQARLATGDTAGAEALLGTLWGHMATPGTDFTGTMWENIATDGSPGLGTTTSLAHGWSTAPTSALSGYVLGAQPVTAGYATWSVQPHPGDLTWAEGRVPTPARRAGGVLGGRERHRPVRHAGHRALRHQRHHRGPDLRRGQPRGVGRRSRRVERRHVHRGRRHRRRPRGRGPRLPHRSPARHLRGRGEPRRRGRTGRLHLVRAGERHLLLLRDPVRGLRGERHLRVPDPDRRHALHRHRARRPRLRRREVLLHRPGHHRSGRIDALRHRERHVPLHRHPHGRVRRGEHVQAEGARQRNPLHQHGVHRPAPGHGEGLLSAAGRLVRQETAAGSPTPASTGTGGRHVLRRAADYCVRITIEPQTLSANVWRFASHAGHSQPR